MERRKFIQAGLFGTGALMTANAIYARQKTLRRLPSDFEGPFYPVGDRSADSADLLRGMIKPHGDILQLSGQIRDEYGDPVKNATMDIWQTDPLSRYNHPSDRNPGERFSDFAYWGKAVSDTEGRYSFRTYMPGAYRPRPAHIHFKIWRDGKSVLTSQIYFFEKGGTQGHSRYSHLSDRQVTHLVQKEKGRYESDFQVVI